MRQGRGRRGSLARVRGAWLEGSDAQRRHRPAFGRVLECKNVERRADGREVGRRDEWEGASALWFLAGEIGEYGDDSEALAVVV
jgi:hypothetical protein